MSPISQVNVTAMKISTYWETAGILPQRTSAIFAPRKRKTSIAVIDSMANRTEPTWGTERPILTRASTKYP